MKEIVYIDINQTEVIIVNNDGRIGSFKISIFIN